MARLNHARDVLYDPVTRRFAIRELDNLRNVYVWKAAGSCRSKPPPPFGRSPRRPRKPPRHWLLEVQLAVEDQINHGRWASIVHHHRFAADTQWRGRRSASPAARRRRGATSSADRPRVSYRGHTWCAELVCVAKPSLLRCRCGCRRRRPRPAGNASRQRREAALACYVQRVPRPTSSRGPRACPLHRFWTKLAPGYCSPTAMDMRHLATRCWRMDQIGSLAPHCRAETLRRLCSSSIVLAHGTCSRIF